MYCLHLAFDKSGASSAECLRFSVVRAPGAGHAFWQTRPCRCSRLSPVQLALTTRPLSPRRICQEALHRILNVQAGEREVSLRGSHTAVGLEVVSRLTEAWRTGFRSCLTRKQHCFASPLTPCPVHSKDRLHRRSQEACTS